MLAYAEPWFGKGAGAWGISPAWRCCSRSACSTSDYDSDNDNDCVVSNLLLTRYLGAAQIAIKAHGQAQLARAA